MIIVGMNLGHSAEALGGEIGRSVAMLAVLGFAFMVSLRAFAAWRDELEAGPRIKSGVTDAGDGCSGSSPERREAVDG